MWVDEKRVDYDGVEHEGRVWYPTNRLSMETPEDKLIDSVCVYRGDECGTQAIVEAGYSPIRRHYLCKNIKLNLDMVTDCQTCGGDKKAHFCGTTCVGYTPNTVY